MALDFNALGYFGNAAGDLFGAAGEGIAAKGYTEAAGRERLAAKITAGATVIQRAAAYRQVERTLGGQRADIASAGFSFSGSAIDLMADSARQGAISDALIENQGQIEVQGHESSAAMYENQAAQAKKRQSGGLFSGLLNIGLGVLGLFSDKNLKHNIVRVGENEKGVPIYEYSYIGSDERWRGYIAQEVEKFDPSEVIDAAGVLGVSEKYRPVRI